MGDFAFKIIDLDIQKYAFLCYYLPMNCLPELDGKICVRPYFEKILDDLQIIDSRIGLHIEQFGGQLVNKIKNFGAELLDPRDKEPPKVEDKMKITSNFRFDLLERLLVIERLKKELATHPA